MFYYTCLLSVGELAVEGFVTNGATRCFRHSSFRHNSGIGARSTENPFIACAHKTSLEDLEEVGSWNCFVDR